MLKLAMLAVAHGSYDILPLEDGSNKVLKVRTLQLSKQRKAVQAKLSWHVL